MVLGIYSEFVVLREVDEGFGKCMRLCGKWLLDWI